MDNNKKISEKERLGFINIYCSNELIKIIEG